MSFVEEGYPPRREPKEYEAALEYRRWSIPAESAAELARVRATFSAPVVVLPPRCRPTPRPTWRDIEDPYTVNHAAGLAGAVR